jgi:hypothetical protein
MAGGDAVDLVLDRAGIGVDIDAGGIQMGVIGWGCGHRKQAGRSQDARRTPLGGKLRGKHGLERACHGILFAYHYAQKSQPNQGKQA